MSSSADAITNDIAAEFAALRQDVARLTASMGELVRQQTQAATFGAAEAVGVAQHKIAEKASGAQDLARVASEEIQAGVARNPLTAFLVVFGIGISLGLFSRSRG